MASKKIGIINSGGDCAGLNTVIAALVKSGVPQGYEFIGFDKGWEGLLDLQYKTLELEDVRGISHLGGTILHTTNKGRFSGKVGTGDVNKIPDEILNLAKQNVEKLGLAGLIVIGGDGTLSAALQLADLGVNIVGVPKTIDNDLSATDVTFGFGTAIDVAVDAIDKIHTTATSHGRVFLVECMGRHAGWISLYAGLAANANMILLPEFVVDMSGVTAFLRDRMQTRGFAIVVVAEGILQPGFEKSSQEAKLRDASENLMLQIDKLCPGEFEMRNVVLGHIQRGGNPNAEDRILAKRYGVGALEAFELGKFGHMVRIRGGVVDTVSIQEATGTLKLVTKDDPIYKTAKSLGVYLNG